MQYYQRNADAELDTYSGQLMNPLFSTWTVDVRNNLKTCESPLHNDDMNTASTSGHFSQSSKLNKMEAEEQ